MSMHPNSLQAYYENEIELAGRCREIYIELLKRGEMTDRELKDALGYKDMNSVRPRITELIDCGRVREVGQKHCPHTHKTVRVVDAIQTDKKPVQKELL